MQLFFDLKFDFCEFFDNFVRQLDVIESSNTSKILCRE